MTTAREISRNQTDQPRQWSELKIKSRCAFREPLDLILSIFGFVVFHSLIDICLAKFQHAVDESGEFVSHGSDSFRRSQFSPQSSEVGSQRALASKQTPGRHAQGRSRPVDHMAGTPLKHFAAADAILRAQSQPGGELLFFPPTAHFHSPFPNPRLPTLYLCPIHPEY